MEGLDIKDIIKSQELGGGFLVFQNPQGYFFGIRFEKEIKTLKIDKSCYNRLKSIEGKNK